MSLPSVAFVKEGTYRPMILTSMVGTFLEKILTEQIYVQLENVDLLEIVSMV